MDTLQEQVKQFLRQEWFKQREEERRRKQAVVSQTLACAYRVRIPCGSRGQCIPYGIICDEWRDTVDMCQKLDLPLHFFFPDVMHYREVKEAHVRELAQRVQDDVQFRWQVLNACTRQLQQHEQGQAWVSKYLCSTRWLPLGDNMLRKWEARMAQMTATVHGAVENMFIAFATLLSADKWPHVYAWCLIFLAHLADTGLLPPPAALPAQEPEQLMEWLLQYYDPDWQCVEAVALQNLSTAWRRRCASTADVPLPLTTCPTYDAFEAAVAAQVPQTPPPATGSPQPETRSSLVRMTRKSALHSPMFFDPDKLTFI